MSDNQIDLGRGVVEEVSAGEFKAAKTIIASTISARAAYHKLRANHLKRINLYKEIEGLIQGSPPYDPAELRAAGLQHIANFNDMSARAVIKRACLAYWNLLYNSETLVNFVLRIQDPNKTEWAKLMSFHWDYVVKRHWPSFSVNVASLSTQLVKFGISPVLFPDERDPKWRVVELNKFYVPDQAQSDLDLLTTVFVETDFTVQYLWGVYQEFKDSAEDSPWNPEQIGKLLVQMTTSSIKDSNGPADIFDLERKINSGDISFDNIYSDSVKIVSMFQKEYEGKISHYMFHRYFDHAAGVSNPGEDFIFFEQDQFQSMAEALVIFTANPGEFTIHSNRGLGHEIFSLAQAKIMLDCSVVDMAKWASTPILKSPNLNTKDSDQIRFYPGVPTNIGSAEFVQNNLGANVQGVVGAAEYVTNLMQFNISYSGSDPASPDPDQGSISPSQTRLSAFREFSVLKNNIMHFYATFDRLIANMTAKMLRSKEGYPNYEMAREWKQRCIEDGVPEEVFKLSKATDKDTWGMPSTIEVHATRAAGAGSQVAHLIGLQELQSIAGSFGPREERAYKRQLIIAAMGPEHVDTFMQEGDDVDEKAGGASLAGVENAIMQAGKSPIFSPDNEHRAHAATHMALLNEIISKVQQQQMSPIEADSIFNVSVPHTGEHIQALANNPFSQADFGKFKEPFGEVSRYATFNRKNAQKMIQAQQAEQQKQQEATQQVMSDEEIKNMQAQNDEQRSNMKLSAQMQRQEEAGTAKKAALEKKTEGDLSIKRRKAEGEIQVAKLKQMKDNQNDFLTNTSIQDAQANPSKALTDMKGNSPSPTNIEGIPRI